MRKRWGVDRGVICGACARSILFLFAAFFLTVPSLLFANGAQKVIVALGDSITAGAPSFISPLEYPPAGKGNEESQYSYWVMQAHPEWFVLNRGVSGERTDEILKRFDSDALAHEPNIVIVMAGVNDLSQGYEPAWVKKHLTQIYRRAIAQKINVLACTIIPYNGATPGVQERMKEVNKWIMEYSELIGAGNCDTYKAMEDKKRPGRLISTKDGLHPDIEGYQILGEKITGCLDLWVSEVWGE